MKRQALFWQKKHKRKKLPRYHSSSRVAVVIQIYEGGIIVSYQEAG
jgi:hypothetical protein